MATTWAQLLSDLRNELKDTEAPYTWSDGELYTWVKDALADYSTYNPVMKAETLSVIADASYAFPNDFLSDMYVECPENSYLKKTRIRPGRRYINKTGGTPTYYWVMGNTLFLNTATDKDVELTYQALHPSPSTEDDTSFEMTIPSRDEELIRLYMRAKAYEQMRSNQSSLDRFSLGSGDRDDNPLTPETDNLMETYEKKIYERYGGGVITLYKS